jgi:thioredoxin-related protein
MKHLALILFSISILSGCNTKQKVSPSQKIQWLSLGEVQEKMKSHPKKVLIDIYTDWCGPCKRMSKYTFTNSEVIKIINKEFYAVKFNAESKESVNFLMKKYSNSGRTHDFAIQVGSTASGLSYPTIIYFNESFKKIQSVPGYFEPQEFSLVLKYFGKNHFKNMSYEAFYKSQN